MCGIFGYIGGRNNAATLILKALKTLEYRGYDSWGVAIVPTATSQKSKKSKVDVIVVKKRTGKIGNATVDELPGSSLGFGHTRWATHGGVTEKNAHPHLDCTGKIAVIHNGIIENYGELKRKLTGHTFISETDSEVAAHMVETALCSEFNPRGRKLKDSVRKTFNKIGGSNAIIAINADNREIVAVKNGSPLVVGYGKKEYFVASDASALLPYTKTVYYMEDYDMAILTDTGIQIIDAKTNKKKIVHPITLTWNAKETTMNRYESFMVKEIHEQPEVINSVSKVSKNTLLSLTQEIQKSYGTYLIGCGTASYACMAGSYLFSTIAKRHINVAIASEFGYQEEFITKKSLVIALSQSGETMDLLEAVKKAKSHGATIASLVNVAGSTLSRVSDITIFTNAGPEIGVASTKDMISKLAHLIMLAYGVVGTWNEGVQILQKASDAVSDILTHQTDEIQKIAEKIKLAKSLFVVGRGLSYPAALETALKIKEISYIHAEGLAAGELKHGPIALIEKGTPCVVFVPNDETHSANLAAAMEMKARGGLIIGIANTHHDVFDINVAVKDAGTGTIIPNIVVGQLLAYYLTKLWGFDPDKPRNLAKSVTVK